VSIKLTCFICEDVSPELPHYGPATTGKVLCPKCVRQFEWREPEFYDAEGRSVTDG